MELKYVNHIQGYVARYSVSASAARGQGAPGLVQAARDHFASLRLEQFAVRSEARFLSTLDRQTTRLLRALPRRGRKWGVARKLLNIFLRNAFYTTYLRDQHRLDRAEPWMEVPLDRIVATRIRTELGGNGVPRWPGVKHLTSFDSRSYQLAARMLAIQHAVAPVHLDALFWGGSRDPLD